MYLYGQNLNGLINYFNHFGVFLHRQRHATDVRYRNDATSDLWATHSRGWGYISTT